MAESYELTLGAIPLPEGGVAFRVWAPRAKKVAVKLLASPAGAERVVAMRRGPGGLFTTVIAEARPGAEYVYVLDGQKERPDPASRHQPRGIHGPSQVVATRDFPWSDAGWPGVAQTELVVYELHVGTFTPEGSFAAAQTRLPYLRDLGITAVELMPIAAFPGGRNWGYDGVALFAPQASYGGPEGLFRFVDACHRTGLACILDVVYNHLGPEGNYLPEFAPYFSDHHRTAWGEGINFDGKQCAGVRRFVLENALYWLREYHLDGLRLDAVDSIFDTSPRHILAELKDAFAQAAAQLGRRAYLIAETDQNDARIITRDKRGGLGLDGQWSDDFHHSVHAALTGDRHGYFADFGRLSDLAKAMSQGYVYDGRYSGFRQAQRGGSAAGVRGEQLVICTQNHDQIANGSRGRRLGTVVGLAREKLAACALLLSPNVPMLFMGQEYGEAAPFHYFISHSNEGLVESIRRGREREFAAFHPEEKFADPHSEATFHACRLDWTAPTRSPHAELLFLYRDLLALRRRHPSLGSCRRELCQVRASEAESFLVLERADPTGEEALAIFNFSATAQMVTLPQKTGRFTLILSSAAVRYGGPGETAPPVLRLSKTRSQSVLCPPWGVLLYLRSAKPARRSATPRSRR